MADQAKILRMNGTPEKEPNTIEGLFKAWKDADTDAKAAAKSEKEAKTKLLARIPAGETRKGIQHQVITKKAVSWKKVAEDVKGEFVPDDRLDDYVEFVEDHTSESSYGKPKDIR